MLLKIIAVGFVTIITSSVIKQYRPDIALLMSICGGLVIVMLSIDSLLGIFDQILSLSNQTKISNQVIKPIIKIVGIGYITEFCANIAEDSGNKTIQSKILLGGKIAICVATIPCITNMLNAILSLL